MNSWKHITKKDTAKLAKMTPIFEDHSFTSSDTYYKENYDIWKTRLIIERHYSPMSKFAEYCEDKNMLDVILVIPQEDLEEWEKNWNDKELTDKVFAAAELY